MAGTATASDSGDAYNNTATVSGGSVDQDVFGGLSFNGNAWGNTATVSGGSAGGDVFGGQSFNGNAWGNTATVGGVTVGGNVIGGYAFSFSGFATAMGNSVTVSGGTVGGNVIGGLSELDDGGGGSGSATGNSVTVGGAAGLADSELYGGLVRNVMAQTPVSGMDAFSGNILNLKTSGLAVKGLYNFQNINFYLPATLKAGETVLSVTDEARLSENADGSGRQATVNVGIAGRSSPLAKGDQVVLIDAGTLTGTPANSTAQGMQGVTLLYDFDILVQGNQLLAAVASIGVTPQTKALSEGRVSGLAFVNQGADLAAGQGMASMLADAGACGTSCLVGFGAISGGTSRYDTGSHTDVDGFSLLTGLGWRAPLAQNSLLLGVFFELGRGNYDSHNSFNNAASVKGKGDMEYYGGGVLARYGLTGGSLAGLYTEASLRAGHLDTDFSSSDFMDFSGPVNVRYDSGSAYYGAHAGLGYVWNITDKTSLDFSTKYLWTHQDSDSVTVAGDRARFRAADSHRWRNGARFDTAVDTPSGARFTPYVGAYYHHEFDGKAKATVYGHDIPAPDLKGGTGIGEVGVRFKPAKDSGLALDLGVQGYVGTREGVTGTLQVRYVL